MHNSKGKIILSIIVIITFILAMTPYAQADALGADPAYGQELRVVLYQSTTANLYSIEVGEGTYDIVEYNHPDTVLATVSSGTITFTYHGTYGNYTYSYNAGGKSGTVSSPLLAVPRSINNYFYYNDDGTVKSYRGSFKAIRGSTRYCAVNQVYVELYLYGVVGRELGYNYNMDATMAQAVASRSYALAGYSSSNTYYDLTDDTYSQVYDGKSAETPKIIQAVDDTRGWALKYNNQYVRTYFSSNMGGHSENIENVWLSNAVPIVGVPSPYDEDAGVYGGSYGEMTYHYSWEYTPEELVALANRYGNTDIGTYQSISFSTTYNGQTSVSNRQMIVTITGNKGSVTATKDNIRSLLDLWSTKIRINGEVNGIIVGGSISIDRYGFGHGVGLSQFGAIGMGANGYTWNEIIEHYFCANTDISLVTSFEAIHTVSASAGDGGSINPVGDIVVLDGDDQTFTFTANSGYKIADVLVDGVSVGAVSTYTLNNVTEDHTIAASFEVINTIEASAGIGGSIDPTGDVIVVDGEDQSFTITADSGYQIADVLVDGVSVGISGSYTFNNVTEDHTIAASFEASHTISASAGTGGSIDPTGDVVVVDGDNQTYTIAANSGYRLADVLVDGVSVGAVSTHAFTNVTADHTIEARFIAITWINPFNDVKKGVWYYDAVKYANLNNLMNGTSSNRFAPDIPTTRGMIVTILWRIEGEPNASASTFRDLSQDWYRTAVNWAAKNEIVDGYSSTRYGPNDNITREQLMKILYSYAEYKGYDISATTSLSSFSDASTVSSWAVKPTKWAVAEGYVNGIGGKINPQGNATRAQVAAVLYRFLEDMK